MNRIAELGREAKSNDDRSNTDNGEGRGATSNDAYRVDLVNRERHGELCDLGAEEAWNFCRAFSRRDESRLQRALIENFEGSCAYCTLDGSSREDAISPRVTNNWELDLDHHGIDGKNEAKRYIIVHLARLCANSAVGEIIEVAAICADNIYLVVDDVLRPLAADPITPPQFQQPCNLLRTHLRCHINSI